MLNDEKTALLFRLKEPEQTTYHDSLEVHEQALCDACPIAVHCPFCLATAVRLYTV